MCVSFVVLLACMGFAVLYILVGSQLGTMHTAHELNYVDRKQVDIPIKVTHSILCICNCLANKKVNLGLNQWRIVYLISNPFLERD